jgi:non-ribosomal peptide synthetase component F
MEEQIRYWKEKLRGYETLNLITDKERPAQITYEGEETWFELGEELSREVRALAKGLGVSVYTVLLSAYYLLLSAYSGQTDLVVGTVTANREYSETSKVIGFFVNTLVIRQKIDSGQETGTFIREVGEAVTEAQRNQEVPFEKVVEALGVEKDMSRSPIFQTMFTVQSHKGLYDAIGILFKENNFLSHGEEIPGIKTAKFDIVLSLDETVESIGGIFNYASSLFEPETIESYIETYIEIVNQFVQAKEGEV